jgi:hypothetical protein
LPPSKPPAGPADPLGGYPALALSLRAGPG